MECINKTDSLCLGLSPSLPLCFTFLFDKMIPHRFCSDLYHYTCFDAIKLCAVNHTSDVQYKLILNVECICGSVIGLWATACSELRRLSVCGPFRSVSWQCEWFGETVQSLSCHRDGEGFGSWLIDRRKWMKAQSQKRRMGGRQRERENSGGGNKLDIKMECRMDYGGDRI